MIKKHILITGGGTGIGCALAKRFAAKGWQVIIVGRRSELLQDVVSQYPDSIRAVTADVGKHEDRQIITSQVQEPLHLLVHNAAVLGPVGPLLEVSLDDWRSHMASNVEGPLFLTRELLPKLVEGSRVIQITSGAAHHGKKGIGLYCTSKAALFMLGQILKDELAKQGVWFGTVIPGQVDTPMQAEIRAIDSEIMPMVEQWRVYKTTGSLLKPEFVAQFLVWLLLEVHGAQLGEREWNIRDSEWQHASQRLA